MDIPAVLEFILSKTGREKLIYIGYSMGCSMFFVAMATFPELGSKIEMMIGMAPAVSLAHMTSPVIRRIAPYVKQVEVDSPSVNDGMAKIITLTLFLLLFFCEK